MHRYDTYCGLYCGACNSLVATREGELADMAAAVSKSPEQLACNGCKSGDTCEWCEGCDFADCCKFHGYESCAECPEMPCVRLRSFRDDSHPHHDVVERNLLRIREIGLEKWLEEQARRWSCEHCGASVAWYQDTCKGCGRPVYDARKETEQLKGGQ
jgi:hypothetical protein